MITGGSSGIGAALARRLADRGWRCVLVARGRERLERLAAEVDGEIEACDVTDRPQVDKLAGRVGERHKAIRLLVNSAGIPGGGTFLELEAERIEAVTRTNYLAGVWCLRAFVPLLERGSPAAVVNVASIAGTIPIGSYGPYTAAKHAQLAFSRNVAAELASRGIRVLSVNPGPVETEGFPQTRLLAGRLSRRLVISPERVAEATLEALDRRRGEIFVPGIFRIAAAAEGVVPGLVTKLGIRRGPGRWGRGSREA
ncbi:MAG TPA: SDR family NAD(P)-dependent oxidoreductase [Gaiellaceae bacterium]|nr:SDR family NAD(P)-dependent oxidoreductase [Gaiellaceae bacterium]